MIHTGVYREEVKLARSGTAKDKMITIRSADGETPVLKGSDVIQGWKPFSPCVWVSQSAYPRLPLPEHTLWDNGADFRYDGRFPAFVFRQEQLFVNGSLMLHVPSAEMLIGGSYFVDDQSRLIYLCPPVRGMDPNDARVEISTRPRIIDGDGRSFIRIANLTLTHCANFVHSPMLRMGATTGAYEAQLKQVNQQIDDPAKGLRGWELIGNDVSWGNASGIGLNGRNHVVKNNRVHHLGQMGWGGLLMSNVLFEGNEGSWCNIKNYPHLWEGGGLKFAVCDHVRIVKHKAFHNKGPGIWYDIEVYDSTVEDSVAAFNYHCGIMVEISERLKVIGNLVYKNRQDTWCGSGILVQLCCHSEIAGNICVDNEQFGIYMRWHPRGNSFKKGNPQYLMDYNRVHHNVMCNNGNLEYYVDYQSEHASHNQSDNNIFYNARDMHVLAGFHSLNDWRHQFGHDLHSQFVDPGFVDEDGQCYDFLAGSAGEKLISEYRQ